MELNKERFEAWLYSQPRDRKLDLLSRSRCALCTFFKETTNKTVRASFESFVVVEGPGFNPLMNIPDWFKKLVNEKTCPITNGCSGLFAESIQTFGELQDRFRQIFPLEPGVNEPDPSPSTPKSIKIEESHDGPVIFIFDECISST